MKILSRILTKESQDATASDDVDSDKIFRLVSEVTNNEVDSHHHFVSEKFMKQMRAQLNTGKIPFVAGHDMDKVLGKCRSGKMQDNDTRLIAETDVLRGWNYGISSDEFIKGVENGMLTDVSGGYRINAASCTICNKQAYISRSAESYEDKCWEHLPGRKYKGKVAKWNLEDGEIIELSGVPLGANKKSEILEFTKQLADETELLKGLEIGEDFSIILPFLDETYEILKTHKSNPVFSIPEKGADKMANEQVLATHIGRASTLIKELPSDQGEAVGKIIDAYSALNDEHATLKSEVETYKEKAEAYDKYENSLIADAIKYGIQAEGDDFDKEKWEKVLKGYNDLELVDLQANKWKKEADEEFGEENGGGRQTDAEKAKKKSESGDEGENEETDVNEYNGYNW